MIFSLSFRPLKVEPAMEPIMASPSPRVKSRAFLPPHRWGRIAEHREEAPLNRPDDGMIFDLPREPDRTAIAELLAEDMAALGVDQNAESLLEVADLVIADGGDRAFCRVARPEAGHEPVGFVLANIVFSVKFAGRALWIDNLYVSTRWRRRGLGRRLVAEVLDWAEVNGIKGVDLEAYQGNTPAAILYRELGFDRLNRERFYFSFKWLDET
jgi:ribosomal protein S18 acetylase RimI-like enzyme